MILNSKATKCVFSVALFLGNIIYFTKSDVSGLEILSNCTEAFSQVFLSKNETELSSLTQHQDAVHCEWKNNVESVKAETLQVVFKLSESEETAGSTFQLPNGTVLYLDGSGVLAAWDLKEFLNLRMEYSFANTWNEAWDWVDSGSVELGVPLRTIQLRLTEYGALTSVALLHPLVYMSSDVYFRPPPLGLSHYLLVGPLQFHTWAVLLLLWSLCVFVCCTIQFIYRHRARSSCMGDCNILMSDLILWTVAVIIGKEYPVPRREPAGARVPTSLRIALLSAMCLSVIMLAVYTAKIMAIFSSKNVIIKSPEDLLAYKYTLSSFSHVHLERVFKDLVKKPEVIQHAVDNFPGGEDALKKLIAVGNPDPRFAFLTHPDGFYMSAYQLFHNYTLELCSVSSFTSTIKSARSMYIKKGSKFREVLNWKILQLIERGINFRHQLIYRKRFEYSCFDLKGPFEELSLYQTLSLFLLLALGASLAVLFQLFELVHMYFISSWGIYSIKYLN